MSIAGRIGFGWTFALALCVGATVSAQDPVDAAQPESIHAQSLPAAETAPVPTEARGEAGPVRADTANTAAACFPACREGFICHQGACVTACNPPCPSGEACTAEARCEATSTEVAAYRRPTPKKPKPMSAARKAALEHRDRVRKFRDDTRLDGHLTLDGFAAMHPYGRRIGTDGDLNHGRPFVLTSKTSVGYAKNLLWYFGVMARGTLSLGSVASNSEGGLATRRDAGRALYYGIEAEVVPYLGPFGSFTIGPMLSLGVHGYAKDRIVSQDGDRYKLTDRVLGGIGLTAGMLLGQRRNIHLSWFIRGTRTYWMPWQMGIGLGYRFGLGAGPIP